MRRTLLVVLLSLLTAGAAVAATLFSPFFLGAPAGNEVPFEAVVLPPISGLALPMTAFRSLSIQSAFTPPLQQLLEGETLITTDRQMREVWARLFSVPYDAAQFDFASTFVVFMGGGVIANGSFDISGVEQVDASYASPGDIGGTATESFLSVTATTFLSGVQPKDPPPASSRVSAVKVSRSLFDHVVFRRNLILGV